MNQQDAKKIEVVQKGGIGSTLTQTVNNTTRIVNQINVDLDTRRSPSIISSLVSALANSEAVQHAPFDADKEDFRQWEIQEKLDNNNVVQYQQLISRLTDYYWLVEEGYSAVTEIRSTARQSIFTIINQKYHELLGKHCLENGVTPKDYEKVLAIVRSYADGIIEQTIDYVLSICQNSSEAESLYIEDITSHSRYIVFHAFTECKILEKPQ